MGTRHFVSSLVNYEADKSTVLLHILQNCLYFVVHDHFRNVCYFSSCTWCTNLECCIFSNQFHRRDFVFVKKMYIVWHLVVYSWSVWLQWIFCVLNRNDSEHYVFLIFRIKPVTEFNNFCTVHSCATEPPWLFQCPFKKWWKWIRDPLNITDTIIWPLLAHHNHDDRNTHQFESCGSYARTEQYKQSEGVSSDCSYRKIKIVGSQFLNF